MAEEFSTGQVCAAVGVSFRRVDYWIRRGYLELEDPLPGSGQPRSFTFKEALQVAVMMHLTTSGIQPHKVHPAVVIRDEGVFHDDWTTVTLNMARVVLDLAKNLGMQIDGAPLTGHPDEGEQT